MSRESADRQGAGLSDEAIEAAAGWFVQLGADDTSEADIREWQTWRCAQPENERAWRKAEALANKLGQLPRELGRAALEPVLAPRRLKTSGATTFCALLLIGLAAWFGLDHFWQPQPTQIDLHTVVGEQRRYRLSDGTELTLNTASHVLVAFDTQGRTLRLVKGEILVHTGHDPGAQPRPFAVATAQGSVIPLGTRFTVRTGPATSQVAVTEGLVRLEPAEGGGASALVRAGESAAMSATAVDRQGASAASLTAWTEGRLLADDQPLCEFLGEVARYSKQRLVCDPRLAGRRISGSFPLQDQPRILQSLSSTLHLRVERRADGAVWLRP